MRENQAIETLQDRSAERMDAIAESYKEKSSMQTRHVYSRGSSGKNSAKSGPK